MLFLGDLLAQEQNPRSLCAIRKVINMVVVVLTLCPPRLRGHLTRWLLEISPGVYVGHVTARVRDLIWEQILENLHNGRAIMAYSANNEQGLAFKVHGQEWEPVDFEGITLVMRANHDGARATDGKPEQAKRKTGWSKASRFRKYAKH